MAGTLALLLHPEILAIGAAAAAVPLVIHLLSRRRVRPVRWAAMAWLLAALKKHQRRLRLENLLILLLRMAALALLGLGLARWVLTDSSLALLARQKRSVVLLLDTSYSTAARDGARSVSDRVRAEADKVLSGLGPDDTIVVVVSNDVRSDRPGTRPFVLVPRVVGREGAARAKEALGTLRPTEAPAAWPDALAACSPKAVLKAEDLNRTLVWVTDLQAVDWQPPENASKPHPLRQALEALLREKDAPGIEVIDVGGSGARPLPNLAVTDLSPDDRSDLFQGHGFGLKATVANYGLAKVDGATLRVFLDESPSAARVRRLDAIPPGDPVRLVPGTVQVIVDIDPSLAFRTPGAHSVRAEVSPPEANASADALGLDSRRYLALEVRATLKILCWVEKNAHAKTGPADILKALFEGDSKGGGVYSLDYASDEDSFRRKLSTFAPDCVILANRVPGGVEAQRDLVAFVRAGGALLAFVGDRFDAATWNAAFEAPKESRLLPFQFGPREVASRRGDTPSEKGPWFLDLDTPTAHPLSKHWIGEEEARKFLHLVPPRAWGRMVLVPADASGSHAMTPTPGVPPGEDAVVLRFRGPAGRAPEVAMAEASFGQGHALLAGIGLDDDWLDPGVFPFLPVVLNDGALLLTRQPEKARNVLVGSPIQGPIPRDAVNPRLQVPGRGEEIPGTRAAQSENELPQVVYERVGSSGIWRLSYERPSARGGGAGGKGETKKSEEFFAVNVDPREGSLLRARHEDVERLVPEGALKVLSTFEEATQSREQARQGEISTWVLLAVAILLLLEPYLAMRFGRHGHMQQT